jgi:hypothetical protein
VSGRARRLGAFALRAVPGPTRAELLFRLTGDYRRVRDFRHPGRFAGTAVEVYLAPEPNLDRPVLLFQHLAKTAGTSVRGLVYRNMTASGATLHIEEAPRETAGPAAVGRWYESFLAGLGAEDLARLAGVASHSANRLLPLLEPTTPVRAFTVLREPVRRVVSRYAFYATPREWTLRELYTAPSRRAVPQFFNGQSRALLVSHYDVDAPELARQDGPPPNADLWRERLFSLLDDHYVVGVQEHLRESVRLFAREFRWRHSSTRRVRVASREADPIDDDTAALIRRYNWLDVELYARFARRFGADAAR